MRYHEMSRVIAYTKKKKNHVSSYSDLSDLLASNIQNFNVAALKNKGQCPWLLEKFVLDLQEASTRP